MAMVVGILIYDWDKVLDKLGVCYWVSLQNTSSHHHIGMVTHAIGVYCYIGDALDYGEKKEDF